MTKDEMMDKAWKMVGQVEAERDALRESLGKMIELARPWYEFCQRDAPTPELAEMQRDFEEAERRYTK